MTCSKCKKPTTSRAFATFRTRAGEIRRAGVCKRCRNKYAEKNRDYLRAYRRSYNQKNKTQKQLRDQQRREELRLFVDAMKNVPCADCGKKWPPVAMDFDHCRGAKIKNISSFVGSAYRLELVKEEIKKCEIVCACCHRLRTAKRHEPVAPQTRLFRTSVSRGRVWGTAIGTSGTPAQILAIIDKHPHRVFKANDFKLPITAVRSALLVLAAHKKILCVRRGCFKSIKGPFPKIWLMKSALVILRILIKQTNWTLPSHISSITKNKQTSVVLWKLFDGGFVKRKSSSHRWKSFTYRISNKGRAALREMEKMIMN